MTSIPVDPPIEEPEIEDFSDDLDAGSDSVVPIVGVGASAGGLEAFSQLLRALPDDTGMAFVLVQHLAPSRPSALAEILGRTTSMPVLEVKDEVHVEANHVYVIPPDRSMVVAGDKLQLQQREIVGVHHPVDQFFRSLAQERHHKAIGIVLSGTASDGKAGVEAIKGEGGITFAQDDTAQHGGMPKSAVASGCIDFILPPDQIAKEIVRISQHPYAEPLESAQGIEDKPDLAQVVQLLHNSTGVDFSHYKFNTLYRRVTRRMVFQKMDDLKDYVALLRSTPAELELLFQDILINVTRFFRDPGSFDVLKGQVFPRLLKGRSAHEPVRIWTLGCSTGQEAYSLAIAYAEVAEAMGSKVPLQLFATDLNSVWIDKARAGVYPKEISLDVSPDRLLRYFTETEGSYRISKTIRDWCIFSRHNVLADPPFSRIDLISCRNLLIYLEPVLQQRVMPCLHYALKSPGYLWLGGSETTGLHRNLFEAVDGRHKIYMKKPGSTTTHGLFPLRKNENRFRSAPVTARTGGEVADLPREADRLLSARFSPPGVLVTAEMEIIQYRGNTGPYLAPAPGKASLNLLKMVREGLVVAVRAAILRAGQEKTMVREEGLRVKFNGGYHQVAIEVIPVAGVAGKGGGFLVLFEENEGGEPGSAASAATAESEATAENRLELVDANRMAQELSATRDYLQSMIEQQESTNEELQSANEEVQSANEELQSSNEELETSKEEIQSSNEELATVNDELTNRNNELTRVNNDLVNLLGSIQTAIVMVGPDLRVRRFTPTAEKLLNLIPTDVGRPLADINLNLGDLPDLQPLLLEVLDTVSVRERDVRDRHGRWFSLRLRPYRTVDHKIDGVVVMLVDIDAMKRSHAQTESILATVREPLVVLDKDMRMGSASRAFYETFRTNREETENRNLFEWGNHGWDIPELRKSLEGVLRNNSELNDYELEREFEPIGKRKLRLNARRLIQASELPARILLAIEDVTEREEARLAMKQSEERMRDSEVRYRRLFESAKDGILIMDMAKATIVDANPFMTSLLGYSHDDFIGKELWEIGLFPDKPGSEQAVRELKETGYIRYEHLPLKTLTGGKVEVEVVANTYQEGDRCVIQCNIRDITERIALESKSQQQARELADLHKKKDEFLAMLSHELRNPMAPIVTAVQLMELQGNEDPIQEQARTVIKREVAQLTRLVDDLMEVARFTTGRIQLREEKVNLNEIVAHAVETTRASIEQRRHKLTVSLASEPIFMQGDPGRLEQVVVNLLGNAAKYTDEGGHIEVGLERVGSEAIIRVRDNGIGIAPDMLPHVFELFTQAHRSMDRSQGGLGVGLSLVQRLVQQHGGTVEATSTEGEGSQFIIRLPLPDTHPEAAAVDAGHAPLDNGPSKRVLVVDDNVDAARILATVLKMVGHETRIVHDGAAVLAEALDFRPDVVLLDIGLPGLNGFEVARQLRGQPELKETMLVALTGYGQESDRRASAEAGFDHHLVKPAEVSQVLHILANGKPRGAGDEVKAGCGE